MTIEGLILESLVDHELMLEFIPPSEQKREGVQVVVCAAFGKFQCESPILCWISVLIQNDPDDDEDDDEDALSSLRRPNQVA